MAWIEDDNGNWRHVENKEDAYCEHGISLDEKCKECEEELEYEEV